MAFQNTQTPLKEILCGLDVGGSHVLARKISIDEATGELINKIKEKLHNTARQQIGRATEETGNVYTTDTGDFTTARGHNLMLCFVITRTS